jgi:hypothetical protein
MSETEIIHISLSALCIFKNFHSICFRPKKSQITFSGNPAIFFKIRSFPSPPHGGFGIFYDLALDHDVAVMSRGILGEWAGYLDTQSEPPVYYGRTP